MRMLIIARNHTVATDGDRICAPEGSFDIVLRSPEADVRPGLINAHDHLHRNHYGRLGHPPYGNACHWAHDIQNRYRRHIDRQRKRVSRRHALLAGAWKNLFSGVTAVVHHDPWEEAFDEDFPVRVVRIANADSLGMTAEAVCERRSGGRFALHVAEGVNAEVAGEVRELDEVGLLDGDLLAVHGIGLDGEDVGRFRNSGAALVWCPTSNLFLFGRTAPEALFDGQVDVLLGSDSLLTAQGDLLDELRAARAFGRLSDDRLEDAVGPVAARRLGLPAPSLEPGVPADLVLLTAPLLEACAQHVILVVIGGIPRLARPDVARQLGDLAGQGRSMSAGAVTRWANSSHSTFNRMLQ